MQTPSTRGLLSAAVVDRRVQFLDPCAGQHIAENAIALLTAGLIQRVMAGTDDEQLVGIFDRQRLQHDGVEQAEDRRRRADAERRASAQPRIVKPGLLSKAAKRVPDVLRHR